MIPDFITAPSGAADSDDERELFTGSGGARLIIKSKRKPNAENITMPQWISANARILIKLIETEKVDMDGIVSYLRYTEEIGDYMQTCHLNSVLALDDAQRRKMWSLSDKPWTDIESRSTLFYLKKGSSSFKTNNSVKKPSNKRDAVFDDKGREICINWQRRTGCSFQERCNYSHVCIVDGCRGDHPQYLHNAAPRFHPK